MKTNIMAKTGVCLIISALGLFLGCTPPAGVEFVENHAPLAIIAITGDKPVKGDTVLFDGTDSSDPDGDAITFHWEVTAFSGSVPLPLADPGAGTVAVCPGATGLYHAALTVSDGRATASAVRYVYVRPEGAVPGPDASEIKFTQNGEKYDISFIFGDWIWYEIYENPTLSCRWTDFVLWDQDRSPIQCFAYYEPGTEPAARPGVIQIYPGVLPGDLPREWALGTVSAAEFAEVFSIDSLSLYEDGMGYFHVAPYLQEKKDEKDPWAIIRIVIE